LPARLVRYGDAGLLHCVFAAAFAFIARVLLGLLLLLFGRGVALGGLLGVALALEPRGLAWRAGKT